MWERKKNETTSSGLFNTNIIHLPQKAPEPEITGGWVTVSLSAHPVLIRIHRYLLSTAVENKVVT